MYPYYSATVWMKRLKVPSTATLHILRAAPLHRLYISSSAGSA